MAINDDETDDEANYLLIALARRIVSSGHSTRRVQSLIAFAVQCFCAN